MNCINDSSLKKNLNKTKEEIRLIDEIKYIFFRYIICFPYLFIQAP